MTTYTGTIYGTGFLSGNAGGASVSVTESESISTTFNVTIGADKSFTGTLDEVSTVTATASVSGIASQSVTQNTDSGPISVSGYTDTPLITPIDFNGVFGNTILTFSSDLRQAEISSAVSVNVAGLSGTISSNGFVVTSQPPTVPTANPTIYGWLQSNWDYLLTSLQAIQPDFVSKALAYLKTGGTITDFITEIGQDITGTVSGTFTRLGGVVLNLEIGLLDPNVASGVQALYTAAQSGQGLQNVNEANQLQQVMAQMAADENATSPAPAQPQSQNGNQSNFNAPVTGGAVTPLDPPASYAFIYKVGSTDPNFSSIILPYITGSNSHYEIYTMQAGHWAFYSTAQPLQEVKFASPVTTFLVTGADISSLPSGTSWISAVSFTSSGVFTGSITTLTQSNVSALSLPTALASFGVSAVTDTPFNSANAGHLITCTMSLTGTAIVTGSPSLQLNDNEVASYTGGSGTNTLTFTYVVQPSDNVADLKVTGLNLPSGATIHDQAGNALSGSVTADLGIQIATTTSTPATVNQEIASLYVTLYGLAATQTGITYWTNVGSAFDPSITAANAGLTAISLNDEVYLGQQMTAGSPVVNGTTYFQTVYPTSMTDLAYVKALYQNMSGFIGTTAGDQYWLNVLQQSEAANGGNVTLAREAIVGQFTHDFYGNDLTVGAAALGVSASDYALLVAGQQTLRNKATVAQYWATETGVSGGAILNFTSVTDPSFAAAQHVLAGITSDPNTVTVAITGIAAAVAQQNLSLV